MAGNIAEAVPLGGPFTIGTSPDAMSEGLFGQVALWVFEILPALQERGIRPGWQIRSRKYGPPPDYLIIPGFLDCAYTAETSEGKEMPLAAFRAKYRQALGNDWEYLNNLWSSYFRIPSRVLARADTFGDLSSTVGVHFRGTDKNSDLTQTNPVLIEDFILLLNDFVRSRPDIRRIFAASDEASFVDRLRRAFPTMEILHTGAAEQWNAESTGGAYVKANHATLDCVLLSRCGYMLKCQSALSGFAKVLNPRLQAFRVAACKMFDPAPYFPDAFIDRLESSDPQCSRILKRQMKGDWTADRSARRHFGMTFGSKPIPFERPFNWTRVRRGLTFRLRLMKTNAIRKRLSRTT